MGEGSRPTHAPPFERRPQCASRLVQYCRKPDQSASNRARPARPSWNGWRAGVPGTARPPCSAGCSWSPRSSWPATCCRAKNVPSYDSGQSGQAEQILHRLGVTSPPAESVLIQQRGRAEPTTAPHRPGHAPGQRPGRPRRCPRCRTPRPQHRLRRSDRRARRPWSPPTAAALWSPSSCPVHGQNEDQQVGARVARGRGRPGAPSRPADPGGRRRQHRPGGQRADRPRLPQGRGDLGAGHAGPAGRACSAR